MPPPGTETATVLVTAPAGTAPGNGWDVYELKICPTAPAGACFTTNCNTAPKPNPQSSSCSLKGLKSGTRYSVEVGWQQPAASWGHRSRAESSDACVSLTHSCDACCCLQAVAIETSNPDEPQRSLPSDPDATFSTMSFLLNP